MITKIIEDSVIESLARRNIGSAMPEFNDIQNALLSAPSGTCCGGKTHRRSIIDSFRQKIAALTLDRQRVFKEFMNADKITIYYKDGDGSKKISF